jgi:hypothetical protein
MLNRKTPQAWRMGYTLHRRRLVKDRYGEQISQYDMSCPDVMVDAESENAVCWQNVKYWQTGGQLSTGDSLKEAGETNRCILQGALFGGLELSAYDRIVLDDGVYEVRKIQKWPNHRLVQMERIV